MHEPKPLPADEQHLQLLSIFHYILGAFYAVMGCFPVIHLSFGIVMMLAPEQALRPPGPGEAEPPLQLFGAMFAGIALMVIAINWALAGLICFGGRCIAKRSHHTFCLVVACVSCLLMPLGTILGVFTIVVLIRPSVKAMFDLPNKAW